MARTRFLPTLATGILLGAIIALLHIGPTPFTVVGTVGILAGGAAFGAILALAIRLIPHMPTALFSALATLAGGIAGAVWWIAVQPSSSLLAAVLFAAGLALIMVIVEVWFGHAAA
jgi:hypothetical protein